MPLLTIATRKSPLALWQAHTVQRQLQQLHPDLEVKLLKLTTKGDRILDVPLAKVGGKGLFIKELEVAILNGEADIAVHSMKDVPMEFPPGLALTTICQREEPADAFVSSRYKHFDELPEGAIVGTSSLRRQSQLLKVRPDLQMRDCRGNVGTRLAKLDAGEFDAIILAAAGLIRLEMPERINHLLDFQLSLPAAGQGAVGIEARDEPALKELLAPLNHHDTADRVYAERAFNQALGGGCQVPIAAHATLEGELLSLTGRVASLDGKQLLEVQIEGSRQQAAELGQQLAEQIRAQGADEILATLP